MREGEEETGLYALSMNALNAMLSSTIIHHSSLITILCPFAIAADDAVALIIVEEKPSEEEETGSIDREHPTPTPSHHRRRSVSCCLELSYLL